MYVNCDKAPNRTADGNIDGSTEISSIGLRHPKIYLDVKEASQRPTPIVRLHKLQRNLSLDCKIYVKLEYLNVFGSLDDRAAFEIFESAVKDHNLKMNDDVYITAEGSAAVSYAGAASYYQLKLTIFTTKSGTALVKNLLKILDAKIVEIESESFSEAKKAAEDQAALKGVKDLNPVGLIRSYKYVLNQVPQTCRYQTADHINECVKNGLIAQPNAIVVPINTGVDCASLANHFGEVARIYGVLCENKEIPEMSSDVYEEVTKDCEILKRIVQTEEVYRFTRELIRTEGIMAGPSSGAAVLAATEIARELPAGSTIIVILKDGIRNYLNHFLSDGWITQNGFQIPPYSESQKPNPSVIKTDKDYSPSTFQGRWEFDEETKTWSDCSVKIEHFVPPKYDVMVYDSVLDAIGNTPIIKLRKLPEKYGVFCNVYVKCEFFNAGGSTKDRIAKRMVEIAERTGEPGQIIPGTTLIEPTSGNTGIGLSLVSAVKDLKAIIVMPEKMSNEKVAAIQALGAAVIRTPNEESFSSPTSHIGVSLRLKNEISGSVYLDQYCNPGNPLAHYEQTAEEILYDMDGKKIDMVVIGTGTGGTITGVSRKLKEKDSTTKIVGIDPKGSILAGPDLDNDVIFYEVEGIGYDFLPGTFQPDGVDNWEKSRDQQSFSMARELIREEGIFCGGSSGAALHYAFEQCKKLKYDENRNVVVLLPDGVRNYITKFLDDEWMKSRGLLL